MELAAAVAAEVHLGNELESVTAGERAIGIEPNRKVDALCVVAVPLDGTAEPSLMPFLHRAVEAGVFPSDLIGIGGVSEDIVYIVAAGQKL